MLVAAPAAAMALPDRVREFCQEMQAAGISRKEALEAVAGAWPTAPEPARRLVCVRIDGRVIEVVP